MTTAPRTSALIAIFALVNIGSVHGQSYPTGNVMMGGAMTNGIGGGGVNMGGDMGRPHAMHTIGLIMAMNDIGSDFCPHGFADFPLTCPCIKPFQVCSMGRCCNIID